MIQYQLLEVANAEVSSLKPGRQVFERNGHARVFFLRNREEASERLPLENRGHHMLALLEHSMPSADGSCRSTSASVPS